MKYLPILVLVACGWLGQSNCEHGKFGLSSTPIVWSAMRSDTLTPDSLHTDTIVARSTTVDNTYLLGKFDPAKRRDFKLVGKPYTDRGGMWLRVEALEAFKKMFQAAQKDGISLRIISATRTFAQQKAIWEGKWDRFAADAPAPNDRALKILEYSSMPGSSRHHWGTDMDLNDLNNPSFEKGGKYEKVYKWLEDHAAEYQFGQPYTAGRPSGYQEEKWHWSYLPLSKKFLAIYRQNLSEKDIQGFRGAETATEIGIVKNYVLGINPACQ